MFREVKKTCSDFFAHMAQILTNGEYLRFAIIVILAVAILWFITPVVHIIGWVVSFILTICILYYIDLNYGDKYKFWKKKKD